ncbi:hypothetical protein N9059_01655 [bacterium]|nr:hypothetical protein [bacterium]
MVPPITSVESARENLKEARKNRDPGTATTFKAIMLARACFDLGEFTTHKATKADLAKEGIAAAEAALIDSPDSAHALFYLGMNHGQLARTKTLGALGEVKHIESNLLKGIEADSTFQNACNHLYLAILYKNAPGWPASIGSRTKARNHFESAVQLAPDYPYNRIRLIEALIDWKKIEAARLEWKVFDRLLPKLRKKYKSEDWKPVWETWDPRIKDIEKRLKED